MAHHNTTGEAENAIGGYFELELPTPKAAIQTFSFQSARAALSELLLQKDIKRAWLPYFICETVADELSRVGIDVKRYTLEKDLSPSGELTVDTGEAALIVNYFGVCDDQVNRGLDRLPRDRCVLDNSQAYFSPPRNCMGTIYSPRKFFGVPDGGHLITNEKIVMPEQRDPDSISRCKHLLHRLDRSPDTGLSLYRDAEKSLSGAAHRRISLLTQRILESIDYPTAQSRRRKNFFAMHRMFGRFNQLRLRTEKITSSLTYPLWLGNSAEALREGLIAHRIFTPTYWPELLKSAEYGAQATQLAREIVHIPVDQRYTPSQLKNRLLDIPLIQQLMAKSSIHEKG